MSLKRKRNMKRLRQNVRRCYCQGHCPDNQTNGTCEIKQGGMCFTAVEIEQDETTGNYEAEFTYGCLPDEEGGLMQCKGSLVPHRQMKVIECCNGSDNCNKDLIPKYELPSTTQEPSFFNTPESIPLMVLFTSITACIIFLLAVIACLYIHFRRKELKRGSPYYLKKSPDQYPIDIHVNDTFANILDPSSGSGSGLPMLVQRTISKQIHLVHTIGRGRYGEVWLARWRDQKVAVKVFFTTEEHSWFRETEIYQTVLMRHENILGFIAADIKGTGSWTQMWLITDYHEYGSLYDYLQNHVLDTNSLLIMAQTVVSGLTHLHTEIFSTRGKPAIAHRDIKSKNILVKKNGECVIADFGLAVKYCSDTNLIDVPVKNERSGTKRYMAPEILDGTINPANFDAHKMADIYSLGLVLWEMLKRTATGDKLSSAEDYCLPYYDCVPNDPSFEEMQQVVCVKKVRPEISTRWSKDDVLSSVSRVMQECWHANPLVRLTALRVKKTLAKLEVDPNVKIV
ncbi:bone morphogenetic protein receptor type-1B isoform X1 [Onthophagus taurus]|uniref:bone morphogenetic protein receptor type-1B isoform X1 n=1 Tax=Onthophagus taurus TaxID=166361 RepID=UPI000C20A96E|nr:bone morphogenetic protein receptor type-1B isoform X2 [Onthophagus taurus]